MVAFSPERPEPLRALTLPEAGSHTWANRSPQAGHVAVHHTEDGVHGDTGIYRRAALLQGMQAGHAGQIVGDATMPSVPSVSGRPVTCG